MLLVPPRLLSLQRYLDEKQPVSFFLAKNFENKKTKQPSPSPSLASIKIKTTLRRGRVLLPKHSCVCEPSGFQGTGTARKGISSTSPGRERNSDRLLRVLRRNQSRSGICGVGLPNLPPLVAKRPWGWLPRCPGARRAAAGASGAAMTMWGAKCTSKGRTAPGKRGDPHRGLRRPTNRPSSSIPARGTEVLARNDGNSPQGLILTHLPPFPPSPASLPPPIIPKKPFAIRPRPFKPSAVKP